MGTSSVASPWPWCITSIPCCACICIASSISIFSSRPASSTSTSYYQWRGISPHYKCTSTASWTPCVDIVPSFLANKHLYDFTHIQAEFSYQFCSCASTKKKFRVPIITPSCRSYGFYSVVASVRHGPLLNTASYRNLSVMILTSVGTTWRWWTMTSIGTKVCKYGMEC